jgi:hypothetical protein
MTRRRAVRDGEETEMNPGLHGGKPKQNREPENVSSGDRSGAATPRRQRESHQARDNVGEKTERERERLNAVPSVSDVGNTLTDTHSLRRRSRVLARETMRFGKTKSKSIMVRLHEKPKVKPEEKNRMPGGASSGRTDRKAEAETCAVGKK